MLSKEAILEFKKIWKKKFGEDISDEKALDSATSLINLMKIIYRPMTEDEHAKIRKLMKS